MEILHFQFSNFAANYSWKDFKTENIKGKELMDNDTKS